MKEKERIELGCHTKMSEIHGLNTVEEYIDEASDENGSIVSEALYYMYLWCRNI